VVKLNMSIQLKVPDIGDFEQVEIIEVIVKPGENIKKNGLKKVTYLLHTKI